MNCKQGETRKQGPEAGAFVRLQLFDHAGVRRRDVVVFRRVQGQVIKAGAVRTAWPDLAVDFRPSAVGVARVRRELSCSRTFPNSVNQSPTKMPVKSLKSYLPKPAGGVLPRDYELPVAAPDRARVLRVVVELAVLVDHVLPRRGLRLAGDVRPLIDRLSSAASLSGLPTWLPSSEFNINERAGLTSIGVGPPVSLGSTPASVEKVL
eukprot:COSAG04_NODE_77_length_28411_cov_8.599181_22_plen_207_part_00